ncbi:hypothetical protein RBH26_18880 [Natronolimnohabitans sp. A-GB9]|uniref:hypothetical protein n=1 Tax=Natronolimnohabitans sp. A-GB9 TaxID=3069757 RepID=UPI0027B602F7|nr:hypothetical protein [Natronolimnohabitans sp. A-GB9]MDQ2052529.1 hypothetical protein [Natronolimnohabitans sp. A-GB9]
MYLEAGKEEPLHRHVVDGVTGERLFFDNRRLPGIIVDAIVLISFSSNSYVLAVQTSIRWTSVANSPLCSDVTQASACPLPARFYSGS